MQSDVIAPMIIVPHITAHVRVQTCGDEPVGCQREMGKWTDLCACDQPLCNTFSYFRTHTRKDRANLNADHDFLAPPLSHDDLDDDPPVIFQRVDPPLGDFSGYDRTPGNFPSQTNSNIYVFVLVPLSVACVIVIIVWLNYYRNLC
uniref:Uncharacterized protein n=1 Tax=Panagrolaimus sp. JU765 TaxID=591449 RepID=A0AC34Q5N2_9BILA